jgi:hypothetical protein
MQSALHGSLGGERGIEIIKGLKKRKLLLCLEFYLSIDILVFYGRGRFQKGAED